MEGRYEGLEPLDRAYDLSSLSGEVEAVGRGDRSMQQCRNDDYVGWEAEASEGRSRDGSRTRAAGSHAGSLALRLRSQPTQHCPSDSTQEGTVIGAVPLTSSASKDRPTAVTTRVSARRCGPSGARLGVLTDSRWMPRRCLPG